MQRKMHQMRPPGQPDAPAYAPGRDLAWIYVPALREAVEGLNKVNWTEEFKGWPEAVGITEGDFAKGVTALCDAHTHFVGNSSVKEPMDALRLAGFLDVPSPVRVLLIYRLGLVILGGFFVSIRDVTRKDVPPPQIEDIAKLVAVGKQITRAIHGPDSYLWSPPTAWQDNRETSRADAAEAEIKILQRSVASLLKQQHDIAVAAAKVQRRLHDKIAALSAWISAAVRGVSQSWWGRLKFCFGLWRHSAFPDGDVLASLKEAERGQEKEAPGDGKSGDPGTLP